MIPAFALPLALLNTGCGDGSLACVMASREAVVTSIDADPGSFLAAHACAKAAGVKVTWAEGTIARLPFADASYDVVAAITILCFVTYAAPRSGRWHACCAPEAA